MSFLKSFVAPVAILSASAPVFAGETVLYAEIPAWVEQTETPDFSADSGTPLKLFEQQIHLEDGTVAVFQDQAIALDSPQALTSLGTLSAQWMPDKGDLTIHRMELIRDGEVIDVIADGARFEVIRREQGLERRIVNGMLTATMQLPGARLGDVIRFSYSITMRDQALDGEMQWLGAVPTEPLPLAQGRILAKWPVNGEVKHALRTDSELAEVVQRDGYNVLDIALPAPKPEDKPYDAPSRFRLPPMAQFTSYDSWEEVSRQMAPLFAVEGSLNDAPDIKAEAARIMAASSDPLERAAIATQLVQDEISYLLNGMDGGNYIPQSPSETWELRYGDCKAKSVLLLALLDEMGIEAEALLVHAQTGDAVPDFLPMPAAFNHMIVHATIDGRSYWLDGTSSGTRLANIADSPRFFYGLPLRAKGAGLIDIPASPLSLPSESITITFDQSAGVALPALVDITIVARGTDAAPWKAVSELEAGDQRDDAIDAAVAAVLGYGQIDERSVVFDDETGAVTISATGLLTTSWTQDDGTYELEVPFRLADGFAFENDRAKPAWREIPVGLTAPYYMTREIEWLLPTDAGPFELEGTADIDTEIGGYVIDASSSVEPGKFSVSESIHSFAWEIPASQLPQTKRETMRMKRSLPKLVAPAQTRFAWDYRGEDAAKLERHEEMYARIIAAADDDEPSGWLNRAAFRSGTGNYEGALADLDEVIDIDPGADHLAVRANVKKQLGRFEEALADYRQAEDLRADGSTLFNQIELLGLLGRGEEAIQMADEYALLSDDFEDAERVRAIALAWAGQHDTGVEIFRDLVVQNPESGHYLNELCWNFAIWDRVDDDLLGTCNQAVEKSENPVSARDSRAMALLRLGRADEAKQELDAILSTTPGLHESRILRGLAKRELGESDWREDIDTALWANPYLGALYSAYGFTLD